MGALTSIKAISYFNPRSHEGSDGKDYFMGVYEHISIHAPTRGATFLL